jgi:hypothetical protein
MITEKVQRPPWKVRPGPKVRVGEREKRGDREEDRGEDR